MEFDLIELIRTRCSVARADVRLGIGDDAALLLPPAGHELAVSTDTLVAGVHFPLGTSARDLGWKALAVNLSDLAAMGATPAWALLSLTLPESAREFVDGFAQGFAELAAQHGVALVGGDTTRGPLAVGVTVHGFVPPGRALRRDGARAGDLVFVTGTLGDAAAGLRCLDRADERAAALFNAPSDTREALVGRLNRPTPRIAAGAALRELASACIDVSDGLLADLGHDRGDRSSACQRECCSEAANEGCSPHQNAPFPECPTIGQHTSEPAGGATGACPDSGCRPDRTAP